MLRAGGELELGDLQRQCVRLTNAGDEAGYARRRVAPVAEVLWHGGGRGASGSDLRLEGLHNGAQLLDAHLQGLNSALVGVDEVLREAVQRTLALHGVRLRLWREAVGSRTNSTGSRQLAGRMRRDVGYTADSAREAKQENTS